MLCPFCLGCDVSVGTSATCLSIPTSLESNGSLCVADVTLVCVLEDAVLSFQIDAFGIGWSRGLEAV